jgi:hypothetical protein
VLPKISSLGFLALVFYLKLPGDFLALKAYLLGDGIATSAEGGERSSVKIRCSEFSLSSFSSHYMVGNGA